MYDNFPKFGNIIESARFLSKYILLSQLYTSIIHNDHILLNNDSLSLNKEKSQ